MPAIEVRNLQKSFQTYRRREGISGSIRDLFNREHQTVTAVDNISFTVNEGELLGYIGPNGAGKSTSIKMLTGILKPTGGEISVLGYHPYQQRKEYTREIGVVFGQRTQLWWDIAVIESFRLLRAIYGVEQSVFDERLRALNGVLEIEGLYRTPVRKLSLGERMRCDLAASLLHNPRILFLDEPTIGLDAVAKESVRKFLRHINRELKTTIILTTHDLKEIEELCERILILDHGRVIFDGPLNEVRTLPGLERRVVIDFRDELSVESLGLPGGVKAEKESARRVALSFAQDQVETVELLRTVLGKFEVLDLTVNEPDIEQVVMKIYKMGGVAPAPSSVAVSG